MLLSLATVALLAGCSQESVPSGAGERTEAAGVQASPDGSGASAPRDASDGSAPDDPAAPDDPSGSDDPAAAEAEGADPSAGLEVPPAPAATVDSLSELLVAMDTTGPLVTTPLPRSASARGRLVRDFPGLLRPVRASQVESSSISSSGGDRLQVGLVGSSSLAPAEVLLAFRSRLARRGLAEQAAPVTTAGTQAAAFRRGRSVITLTVAPQGSRTGYSLHASLHTGGA